MYIVRYQDVKQWKTTNKLFSFMLKLQTYYHFKLDFQKVDQHTGGELLIHGTKHRKDNQYCSIEDILWSKCYLREWPHIA